MGKIPGLGCVCPALGLWRGAMEVSVVGMGSVSLRNKERNKRKSSKSTVLISLVVLIVGACNTAWV